jgi:hypothetical protein
MINQPTKTVNDHLAQQNPSMIIQHTKTVNEQSPAISSMSICLAYQTRQ